MNKITFKKIIIGTAIALLLPLFSFADNSGSGISPTNFFKRLGTLILPLNSVWNLQVPALGSTGSPCLSVGTTGIFATTTCGSGSATTTWGTIIGTLSDQTDLNTALNSKWSLTGNFGTTAGVDFIGTADNQDFVTKTNGVERIRTTTSGLTGFGTGSPTATGYFAQLQSSISAPVSASFSYQGGSSGYFVGQYSAYYYNIYASKLVGATRIYSNSLYSSTDGAVDANFAPTSFDGSINYTGSGITNSGQALTYNIYAIYSTNSSPITVGSKTVTFDGVSGDGVVNLSWVAPVYGVPTEYWIEQGGNYVTVPSGNTSYQDSSGSFGTGFGGTSQLFFTIFLDTAPVIDADYYTYENTTNFTYQELQASTILDYGSWTSGSPTVSPSTSDYPTLISEGDSYFTTLGASKLLSFYGVAGVPQQSGNLISALSSYGLVTGGFIDSSNIASRGNLYGTSNQVVLSGSGVSALAFSSNLTLSLPQNIHTGATPQFQRLGLGVAASATQSLSVTIGTNTHKGAVIKGAASQSGNLLEFQNSAGTVLSAFNKDGYLSVGESVLNTTSPATYGQSVFYSTNSISDNSATFKSRTTITNTSAMNTYSWAGIWSQVVKTSASTASTEAIYGIGGQIETQAGAGTTAQVKALYFPMQYSSNVTDSRGVDIYSEIASGKTVGTHYSSYIRNMVGAGTLTTQYGIYIEDINKGGTNFAIRSLGGEVAFAGQTNVGLTGGAGKLSILSTSEQLRLYYNTSNYLSTVVGSTGGVTLNAVGSGAKFNFSDILNLTSASPTAVTGDFWNDTTQNQFAFSNGNTLYQGGNVYTSTADATINSTTPTTVFSSTRVGTTSIVANTLKVGQKFNVWGSGYYSTPLANTSTVTITTSFGASTISAVTTAAFPASATNLPFDFMLSCTVRSIGSSGTLVCDGDFKYSTALSGIAKTSNSLSTVGTVTVNTTVNASIDVKASWSAVTTQSAVIQEARIDF